MDRLELIREFYNNVKDMDCNESLELLLNAESKEEQDFIEIISNFLLQERQKIVIANREF